ncbi:MAG: thioredoxin family protein [Gemmataceae bacterium]
MIRHAIAVTLTVLMLSSISEAGKFNMKLNIGDAAPAWKDLPGTDGRKHSLADLKDKEAVVVVFTCNSCPIAVDYEDRIIDFTKKYAGPSGKVGMVAINVNNIEADKLDKMKERAAEKGFNFPYLYDESQEIARAYGATATPEFFVLDQSRKVAYMGALDDTSTVANVKHKYLESAVDAVLHGKQPATKETYPHGCRIRFDRKKRD